LARQVRMRLVGRRVGGVPSLVSAFCASSASDSPTIVWLRARHRGQYVIASQEARGATVSPQRGHRRTDSSPRAPDARRSFTPASRIAAAFLSPPRWSDYGSGPIFQTYSPCGGEGRARGSAPRRIPSRKDSATLTS
jgi:hypothetical protein